MRIKLGIQITTNSFSSCAGAFTKNQATATVTHIVTDSREAQAGDLFFSFSEDKVSAEAHIKLAKENGALCVSSLSSSADFLVMDTKKALLSLASFYKTQLKSLIATFAITGSVGKTTTKEFCASLISTAYKTHKTYMNYNNAIGMSLSVLSAPRDTEVLILELGMNALGEIKELSEAIKPNFAIITNIGTAHIGKLGSKKLIAKAKLEIKHGMTEERVLVPYEEELLSLEKTKFSLKSREANFYLDIREDKKVFYVNGKKLLTFKTAYRAYHHLNALVIAIASGYMLGLKESDILSGITACDKIELRQKIIEFKKFSVFDDSYSSSYEAIKADIEHLKLEYPTRDLICVLGDILELGAKTEEIHKEVGAYAYKSGAKKIYAFGSYSYHIKEGAERAGMKADNIFISTEADAHSLIAQKICDEIKNDEIILIKASHAMRADIIIKEIEKGMKEC